MREIVEFEYLWDGSDPGWVLVDSDDSGGSVVIYNVLTKMMLMVEDPNINMEVCRRMLAAGAGRISEMPKDDV